jgi:hypothetical protein
MFADDEPWDAFLLDEGTEDPQPEEGDFCWENAVEEQEEE